MNAFYIKLCTAEMLVSIFHSFETRIANTIQLQMAKNVTKLVWKKMCTVPARKGLQKKNTVTGLKTSDLCQ